MWHDWVHVLLFPSEKLRKRKHLKFYVSYLSTTFTIIVYSQKYLQKAICSYSCFVHINLSLYITNICICIYDMWKQFEINVIRWCLFVDLFHTPFQNSTYGHVHGQQVNIPVDIRICEEYIYIHIHTYIYIYIYIHIKFAIKKFSNKLVSCIHLHKLFQYWNQSTKRLFLLDGCI